MEDADFPVLVVLTQLDQQAVVGGRSNSESQGSQMLRVHQKREGNLQFAACVGIILYLS